MKIGIDIGGSHIGIGLVDEFGNIQQKKEKYIVEKIENESQRTKNYKKEQTPHNYFTIKRYLLKISYSSVVTLSFSSSSSSLSL